MKIPRIQPFRYAILFLWGAMTLTGYGKASDDFEIELSERETLSMVRIEPGVLLIPEEGAQSDMQLNEDGEFIVTFDEEKELRKEVPIDDGYWLGATPVTQGQWKAVMGSNPSHFQVNSRNLPVENVSWEEVMEFCRKMTERERSEGRLPEGYVYTLPSEKQWEYAARAGTTTRWWFGNSESDLSDHAWYEANSRGRTRAVGRKSANPWGLYDVHGNVWEWTRSGARVNPEDFEATDDTFRVIRGGCFGSAAGFTSSDMHIGHTPDRRSNSIGFRLVLVASP